MKKTIVLLLLLICQYCFTQTIIYEDKLSWLGDDQRIADYVDNEMPEDITVYVIDGPVYRQHFAFVEVLPKKTYIITFSNNLTIVEYLNSYVHEMVHINQFYSGRARRQGPSMIWEGKRYSPFVRYSKRPWEQEAEAIARKFIN